MGLVNYKSEAAISQEQPGENMRGAFSWHSKRLSKKFSMFSPGRSLATLVIYILRGSKLAYKYAILKFVWVREGRVKVVVVVVVGQAQVVHFSCNAKQLNNAPNMMNYSRL